MKRTIIDVLNVQTWKKNFENNLRVLLENKWRSGRLADSLTVDNIRHVREILKASNRFTLEKMVACMPPVGRG